MAPRRQVKERILPSLREKARLTRLTVIQRSTRKTVEKRPRFPCDEVELGSMISIEADGEDADSIIVKNTK